MTAIVELRGASRYFGDIAALECLDLDLAEGEVLGLLGHNGAGKTTTLKLILGVIAPSAGDVRVFGQVPHTRAFDRLRHHLGYLPENVSFYDQLTGREVIRYLARLKRASREQADGLLEQVGLSEAADRHVRTYSKGMRQRLGLAQALLGEPRLLLFDEPTVGLDPIATQDFYATVDELRRKGVAIILCSHVLPGIERHIDRAAIVGQGRMLASGTLAEMRARASLPLTLRARCTPGDAEWEDRLRGRGLEGRRVNGTSFELAVPAEDKMATMRILLADPAVCDVEVEAPSLERLYTHFATQAATRQETAR